MSEVAAYEREPYCRELRVRVMETGESEGRAWAVLDDTLCYPEGGGQPADRGSLDGIAVLDVQRSGGRIVHFLAAEPHPGEALLVLDWGRRFDHMQQHTAQHLLSSICLERFGWATRSFHIGEENCDIELDVPPPGEARLVALEEAVAGEIRAAHPIRCRRVSRREYESLEVRSRGLPEGHSGEIRLVEIEGVDLNTCGGTHVANTAELEAVKLLGAEPLRGGCRLTWIAGGRVRSRLGEHEARNASLRSLLDTGDGELVAIVRRKLEQLNLVRRGARQAAERLAELEARDLAEVAASGGGVAERHFPGAEPSFLQKTAGRFAELSPRGVALLTGGDEGSGAFALVAGDGSGVDLEVLGRRVAEALAGRGGGRPPVFQGKAASFAERPSVVEWLRESKREADGGA